MASTKPRDMDGIAVAKALEHFLVHRPRLPQTGTLYRESDIGLRRIAQSIDNPAEM
jgi:hypothetical protein